MSANFRYVINKEGCWVWSGGRTTNGYGGMKVGGKWRQAHRASYELHVGPIPEGLTLDHLCRNRLCINPEHLEPVPNGVNTLRGEGLAAHNARKILCIRGHEFSFIKGRNGNPRRVCKKCKSEVEKIRVSKKIS